MKQHIQLIRSHVIEIKYEIAIATNWVYPLKVTVCFVYEEIACLVLKNRICVEQKVCGTIRFRRRLDRNVDVVPKSGCDTSNIYMLPHTTQPPFSKYIITFPRTYSWKRGGGSI